MKYKIVKVEFNTGRHFYNVYTKKYFFSFWEAVTHPEYWAANYLFDTLEEAENYVLRNIIGIQEKRKVKVLEVDTKDPSTWPVRVDVSDLYITASGEVCYRKNRKKK